MQKNIKEDTDSQIKLTQDDQLKLIDDILEQLSGSKQMSTLEYTLDYEPVIPQSQIPPNSNIDDNIYSYLIPGSKIYRKTQYSNIAMKIQRLEKDGYENTQRKTFKQDQQKNKKSLSKSLSIAGQKQGNDKKSENQDSLQENLDENIQLPQHNQLDEQKHMYRYYTDNIICFKCMKPGHYRSVCPQPNLCSFCLASTHFSEDCPQKNVCYKCYGFGHMINQCKSKDVYLNRCSKCERNHEGQCFFLTKGKQRTKILFKLDHLYHDQNIRCIRCFGYGHIICY